MIWDVGKFFRAVFGRWITAIGLAVNLVAVILLAIAGAGALIVSWPYLVIAALVLLFIASGQAYVEVLRRFEPALQFLPTEQTLGAPTIRIQSHATLWARAPVCCKFRNHGDGLSIVAVQVQWMSERTFLSPLSPNLVHVVPLVKAGHYEPSKFALWIDRANESEELQFLFEASWDVHPDEVRKLPKKSVLVLDVTAVGEGQPSLRVPLAKFQHDWKIPPKGEMVKILRTEWLLAPEDDE